MVATRSVKLKERQKRVHKQVTIQKLRIHIKQKMVWSGLYTKRKIQKVNSYIK